MNNPRVFFRVHAVQRMFERNISVKAVFRALQSGTPVEDYSAEMPEPSRLILSFQGKRPFHVVMSENIEEKTTAIITVYKPDSARWDKDFVRRRS